jgi:hypothetical protein
MFVRVKRSGRDGASYEYLQLVESFREGDKVRQRLLLTLGRRDQIVPDGTLDSLLACLAKFSERLRVVEKVRTEGIQAHTALTWGPALVFDRLWREQRLPEVLHRLCRPRRFEFDVERACFALALQRLCAPGSDLQGASWLRTVACPGFEKLELHHLYRTVGFLAEIRDPLEKDLFLGDRDLFSQVLDLVFIDTTRGYSRDRRPDQPQVVLCLAVDKNGWPVAWDILPGCTADAKAFVSMIKKLRERFRIGRIIVVADRGMIGKDTIALLEDNKQAPFDFILGCRMRRQKEVSEEVLSRAGRFHKVADNLEVKQVLVEGRRYIVCRNSLEKKKDAAARQAILAKLEAALSHGPKSVLRNKGYARFLHVEKGAVTIDREAIERDARLDGKFVLRTSTELTADEVARAYKSLWRVERAFRETKSTLEVRPIFHHQDTTTIGHIVGCFLALRLEVDLQQRLDQRGVEASWPDVMRDLGELKAVELTLEGQRYRLRTDFMGSAYHAFAAAGVRSPSVVTSLGPTGPPGEGAEEDAMEWQQRTSACQPPAIAELSKSCC